MYDFIGLVAIGLIFGWHVMAVWLLFLFVIASISCLTIRL